MCAFRLTSPEEMIPLSPAAIEKIRAVMKEVRDAGIVGGIGLDVIGAATRFEQQLEELAEEYECELAGFYGSEGVNGGGYYLVERQFTGPVLSGGWAS